MALHVLLLCLLLRSSDMVDCMLFSPTVQTKVTSPSKSKVRVKAITRNDDEFKKIQEDRKRNGHAPAFASSIDSSCTKEQTFIAMRDENVICGSADVEIMTLKKSWANKDTTNFDETEIIRLPFIKNVLTNAQYRNMGVATELLKHIEQQYRGEHDYLYLHVLKSNTKALNLYKKINFEEVRVEGTNINGSCEGDKVHDNMHKGLYDTKVSRIQVLKDVVERVIDPFIYPRPRLLMRKKLKSSKKSNGNFSDKQIIASIENRPPDL